MFEIGDKVVYPVHGAGIIEDVEKNTIDGVELSYYVLRIPVGNMRLLIPQGKAESLGLRYVSDADTVAKVYDVLSDGIGEMADKWSKRYRMHMDKIKSGDVLELAEVVRNLTLRSAIGTLSSGEHKLLEQARDILVSELVLAEDIEPEAMEAKIADIFVKPEAK